MSNCPTHTVNPIVELEHKLEVDSIDYRIHAILKHATCNLRCNLSTPRLASISNVCVGHISRLFRTQLGVSPGHCIKLLRLKCAAELLENTALSVKQVMANVGINDKSHFARDFKSTFGESPSRYRLSQK
jgi:transcriptional regulator GlxA family with amidase domain